MRVNEDEARTIRLMYYMLVNGASMTTIADTLTELKRETGWHKTSSKFSNTDWTPGAVRNVLRNQKYCGDILARKTWTPDFHDHKSRPNRGSKNKYYQADHHEAIVPRSIWNAAQRILSLNWLWTLPYSCGKRAFPDSCTRLRRSSKSLVWQIWQRGRHVGQNSWR